MLKVTMLQTPSITLDGVPVSLPFKRADALLYYMMVQRSATRQELIALLWENRDEATGLKNLRNTLYALKKALGGDFLLSPQKSLILINRDWDVDCDYDRFTQQGDFSAYQGPFLQGFAVKHAFSFDEWVGRTREKLHGRYLSHLAQQAREAHEAGDEEEAIRVAVEYLQDEPFDEEMAAFLMRRFQGAHKYSKAAQVYQKLKEQLLEELGTEPLESTTVLYYEIMNQWNDTTRPANEDGGRFIPVGREAAYAALQAAADSFIQGRARRCSQLLIGEGGSGKSQLIDYFLRWGDLSSLLVLRCSCVQSEEGLPLAPWDRIMLTVWEFLQEEEIVLPLSLQARLGQTFPLFCPERTGPNGDGARTLHQWDHSLQDSMLLLFSAVTRRKKVLLLLEDLQWADVESILLADALLRRLKSGGLMAVFTCRDTLNPTARQRLDALESDGLLHRHRLHPLTEQETKQLLDRELGSEAAERMAPQFYQETGGNLYLLTELTQAYRRSGDIDAILQTMGEILTQRLSGLSENAGYVAQLIALFPEGVSSRLLLELMDGDDRQLTAGLEELRGRGIIEGRPTERDVAYSFIHQRIRELICSRSSAYQLQPLHRRAAELLSELVPPSEGEGCRQIARHFQLAGDRLRALEYQIRALELDSSRACTPFSLFGGEKPLYKSAKELEEQAQQCQKELSALRREATDPAALTELEQWVTLSLGRIDLFQGNTARGSDRLGGLSGSLPVEMRVPIQACYLLAYAAIFRQESEQAERYAATGTRLLEWRKDAIWQAQFQRLRGSCFCLRGEYDKSRYYLQEAIDTLERQPRSTGVRLQLAAAYADYGRVCRQVQDYAEACSYFKRALSLLEDGPWPGGVWIYVHYGRAAFLLEDHARAKELFERGYQDAKVTGELWGRTAAAAYTAYYQMLNGDYASAADSLAAAQRTQRILESPLEGTILNFICMQVRHRMELEQRLDLPLAQLVPDSAEDYARKGIRLSSRIPDVFEAERLSLALRDGITTRVRYRAAELYSKNKHYMAE